MKKTIFAILLCLTLGSIFAYEIYELDCTLEVETGHCTMNANTSVGDIQVNGFEEIREFTAYEKFILSRLKLDYYRYTPGMYTFYCSRGGSNCLEAATRIFKGYEDDLYNL